MLRRDSLLSNGVKPLHRAGRPDPAAAQQPAQQIVMIREVKIVSDVRNGSGVCDHSRIESLGSNRNARFLRCRGCGYVLVRQGDRIWAFPPVEKAA